MEIKKITAIMMLLVCGMFVFANGQADQTGNRGDNLKTLLESGEKVTLTGTLVFENRMMPELTVGTTVYRLMVPRHLVFQLDIDEGEQVTLTGVVTTSDQFGFRGKKKAASDTKIIIVTTATIKGKTYDLEDEYGKFGPGARGGARGGMMRGGNGFNNGTCPNFD